MSRTADISPLSLFLRRVDSIADGVPARDTIPTGYPSLDKLLGGGMRRGDLVVLGGDVGSGKSSLSLAVALRAALDGTSTAFFSGEMSSDRLMERSLCIEGRVRVDDIRLGTLDDDARARVGVAAMRLRDVLPHIDRLPVEGAEGLAAMIDERWAVDLLVIDSLQALAGGPRTTDEALADAVRRLKALALDLNVAILTTAQVSTDPSRGDRRPHLDDFGALGAVKHHADVVLALFREEMYDPARGIEGATELLVRKNRNGGTGYVDLYFYAPWMRFEDMLDPDR